MFVFFVVVSLHYKATSRSLKGPFNVLLSLLRFQSYSALSNPPQTFFLQDNAVVQIRLLDLSRLGVLHYLYLQNNSISALEPGAFLSQGELLELALNGNLIHLVTADVFRGLDHLRILYLAGNQITRLQDYTFRGLHVSTHNSCARF